MTRQVAWHLHQCFVAATLSFAAYGFASADEAFEVAAKQLMPAQDYQIGEGSYAVFLSRDHDRIRSDDLITLDVGVECLSGGSANLLANLVLERDLPTWLVVSVFDSKGRFVGSIPAFDVPETDRDKLERLAQTLQTDLCPNEVAGASVCLSTGPVSAVCGNSHTLFLESPGTYTVQAVCAKRMFDIPPLNLSAEERLAWLLRQRLWKKLAGEACRSAPDTLVVGGHWQERQTPMKPISFDPESPTACRLERMGSTNGGEALVMLRQTNTSYADLYLHEPVMRIVGDGLSPVRLWLRSSDGTLLQDLSHARADWQYGGPHPIVRLPPGGFVCKKHKLPRMWNHLDRTLQAVYSQELFMTKNYAEYRRDSECPPKGISPEDYHRLLLEGRPQYRVKSNVLELPAVDVDGNH